jgi:hypothetical protein
MSLPPPLPRSAAGRRVTHSSSVASECVGAIDSISQTIGDISVVATTIASAVEEQGSATREIARSVRQAAVGTSEVSKNVVGASQAAGPIARPRRERAGGGRRAWPARIAAVQERGHFSGWPASGRVTLGPARCLPPSCCHRDAGGGRAASWWRNDLSCQEMLT